MRQQCTCLYEAAFLINDEVEGEQLEEVLGMRRVYRRSGPLLEPALIHCPALSIRGKALMTLPLGLLIRVIRGARPLCQNVEGDIISQSTSSLPPVGEQGLGPKDTSRQR